MERSYEEKKQFWERMSSSESGSSIAEQAKPSAQTLPNLAEEEKTVARKVPTPLERVIPHEMTKEELLQQLTPEKIGHFETFVKPELEDDEADGKGISMEEKSMPMVRVMGSSSV